MCIRILKFEPSREKKIHLVSLKTWVPVVRIIGAKFKVKVGEINITVCVFSEIKTSTQPTKITYNEFLLF